MRAMATQRTQPALQGTLRPRRTPRRTFDGPVGLPPPRDPPAQDAPWLQPNDIYADAAHAKALIELLHPIRPPPAR